MMDEPGFRSWCSALRGEYEVLSPGVAKVVVGELGTRYPVRPTSNGDSFLVDKSLFHVRVNVHTGDEATRIRVVPFGLSLIRIINWVLARKVITTLEQSELRPA